MFQEERKHRDEETKYFWQYKNVYAAGETYCSRITICRLPYVGISMDI